MIASRFERLREVPYLMCARTRGISVPPWWTSDTTSCQRASASRMPRTKLLALAREERRVLVTEDKDFGELVFLRGLPHPGIVRLVEMTPRERAEAMRVLIDHHANAMRDGAIIVVTENRIRIRSAGHAERNDE